MADWSIEQELCDLAQSSDLQSAARHLGIFQTGELADLGLIQDWIPGGAETYIYVFDAESTRGEVRRLILKAFVPPPGVCSVAEALNASLERAEILARDGVATPQCLGWFSGTALYDYVAHPLGLYLSKATKTDVSDLVTDLAFVAMTVTSRGFAPIDLFRDLRTDGARAYIVDLGKDLGPPGVRPSDATALIPDALSWVQRWTTIDQAVFEDCVERATARRRSAIS